MKTIYGLLICLIFIGFYNCKKDNLSSYKSKGIILGADLKMCPSNCCGGWYIKIDSLTYEFDSIPKYTNINLETDTFPINIKLDWGLSTHNDCTIKRIDIQRIIKY
jgi:hypothetical protein